MNTKGIELKNLTKRYGDLVAVDNLSLEIPAGICFGVLGPNGAGKTTTLEMLEGISTPTSGEIFIGGLEQRKNLRKIQAMMGVQLQENHYFRFLSIGKILKFFIGAFPDSKAEVEDLLNHVDLLDKRDQPFAQLSGGQKQRFSIAVALANDPSILFLDEPTTGLDPQNRQYIWSLVTKLKARDKTIILTTHHMEEAETLCDELVIMDHGTIIARGSPRELVHTIKGSNAISLKTDTELNGEELAGLVGVEQFKPGADGTGWRIWSKDLIQTMKSIYEMAEQKKLEITHMEVDRITLEDVFLSLTGRELRE
jgi:ABC-type multidrug transport system ATPase subunit